MRQQNPEATVPLDVVPARRTEWCSQRFRPGFWSQVSDACRQAGRERNVGPRPCLTDPFRPLSSISRNSYIYNRILVISSMWYIQVWLAVVYIFSHCARALAETLLFMVQSHFKSYVFRYGTRWSILAQNTWHPRMWIRFTHKIVSYLVWISFSAALVKTSWDFQYKRGNVLLLYSILHWQTS